MRKKIVPPDKIKPPMSMEELEQAAQWYVKQLHLPESQTEEAEHLFVVAGVRALSTMKSPGNTPGFQFVAGKWAVVNFLRKENRYKRHIEQLREQKLGDLATQISSGDFADSAVENPLQIAIRREEIERALLLFGQLTEREQLVIREVVMNGSTQKEVGILLHVTEQNVHYIQRRALNKLRRLYFLKQLPSSRKKEKADGYPPAKQGEPDHESTESGEGSWN